MPFNFYMLMAFLIFLVVELFCVIYLGIKIVIADRKSERIREKFGSR